MREVVALTNNVKMNVPVIAVLPKLDFEKCGSPDNVFLPERTLAETTKRSGQTVQLGDQANRLALEGERDVADAVGGFRHAYQDGFDQATAARDVARNAEAIVARVVREYELVTVAAEPEVVAAVAE